MPSVSETITGVDIKVECESVLNRVDAARIDGRARNIRYRQNQLRVIHTFLVGRVEDLVKAIQKDTARSRRECQFEVSTTIDIVGKHYHDLDFDAALRKEKSVALGSTVTDWREPFGTVGIVCEAQYPLNLAVSPLAAAICAGNCAVLIISASQSPSTYEVLQEMIAGLDKDAYALLSVQSTDDLRDVVGPSIQFLILQTIANYQLPEKISATTIVQRPFSGNSFAVVDRTCKDLRSAAARIAQAKFVYGSCSSFAPTFVLVHEAVKHEFMRELLAGISECFPENISVKNEEELARFEDIQAQMTSSNARYGRIVMSGSLGGSSGQFVAPTVVEGDRRRGGELVKLLRNTPNLPIFAIRSLEDAIYYSFSLLGAPALAVYAFAGGPDASYLGQFMEAKSVFINDIPSALSVGPAFPDSPFETDPLLRYTTNLLTLSKLFSVGTTERKCDGEFLAIKAPIYIQPPKQAPGKRLDFFLQGLVVGGTTFLVLTSATIAFGGWSVWKLLHR